MPATAAAGRPLEDWAAQNTKMMRITLPPPDWISLRTLALDRNESIQSLISALIHDRIIEKQALIAELQESL